ncbi:DUF1801 domain-containing protein [Aurantivibrio plasticivorans]
MTDNDLTLTDLEKELESFILACVPKSTCVSKYGGTLFTLKPDEKEGQFCGLFVHTNHVQLSFARGVDLDDPKSLLAGTGKYRRHINYKITKEVDKRYLKPLLVQASKL